MYLFSNLIKVEERKAQKNSCLPFLSSLRRVTGCLELPCPPSEQKIKESLDAEK